ncbi:MAG TPA: hypothetical protein VE868_03130 [Balneolaceae bacterium]|nr:hypothetical protein [Balneolaceae bacterium]
MKAIHSSIIFAVTIVISLMLTGCLGSNNSRVSSQVQFGFQATNFDSTLVSANDSDSISVDRIRFVYGNGSIGINDTTAAVYQNKSNWRQYSVKATGSNPILLFRTRAAGMYSNFVFSVQKAPKNDASIDPDFTGSDRYSMIIDGTYNGTGFTYKIASAFQRSLPITPVANVPKYNASYIFMVKTDVQNWFVNSNGGFYNPNSTSDTTSINQQIMGSFHLQTIHH